MSGVSVSPLPALFATTVNLTKIATIAPPFPGATASGIEASLMKGAIVNGDAVFFNGMSQGNNQALPHAFYAFRVKPGTGQYGEYFYWPSGQPYNNNIAWHGGSFRQVSDNALQFFDRGLNATLQFTIPEQPYYGTRQTVTNLLPSIPSPCGVGTPLNTFYDTSQNLVAYEFEASFPDDYFDYVSIYSLGLNGETLVNGGFIGVVPNGGQGFNQTSLNLPAGVGGENEDLGSSELNYALGWLSYFSVNGNPWDIGAIQNSIVQGGLPLNCNTNSPNSQTYVTTNVAFNWTYTRLSTLPNFVMGNRGGAWDGANTGYCEVPGLFVSTIEVNNTFGMLVYSQNVAVQVKLAGIGYYPYGIVLMADGTLIVITVSTSTGNYYAWDVWQGYFDITAYQFQFPSLTFRAQSTLVNYARPISVNGSFLT